MMIAGGCLIVNTTMVSRVPGLVALNGEEVVGWVGCGEVVFVTQVEDTQLLSGAHLSLERRGHSDSHEDQQATGHQQAHEQPLQPVGGGYGAPIRPEALLAILEVLFRLHPAPVHLHRLARIGQRRGQVPGLPMASGPIEHQVDHHGTVGAVKGLGPELDTTFAQGMVPQPAMLVSGPDHHVALEKYT